MDDVSTLLEFDAVHATNGLDAGLLENIEKDGVVLMDMREDKAIKLQRALIRLDEAKSRYDQTPGDDIVRDGLIHRFEFTYELAWKALRAYLIEQGIVGADSPRATMKAAYAAGILDDEYIWLQMLADRNLTVRLYDENTAAEIANRIATRYAAVLRGLSDRIMKEA